MNLRIQVQIRTSTFNVGAGLQFRSLGLHFKGAFCQAVIVNFYAFNSNKFFLESWYPQMIEIHLPCFFSQLTAQPKISWSNLPSSTELEHSVIWFKSGISSSEICCPKNCSIKTINLITNLCRLQRIYTLNYSNKNKF